MAVAPTMKVVWSSRVPITERSTGAHPKSPGRHAPQKGQVSSLTPTSWLHCAQTIEPWACRTSYTVLRLMILVTEVPLAQWFYTA